MSHEGKMTGLRQLLLMARGDFVRAILGSINDDVLVFSHSSSSLSKWWVGYLKRGTVHLKGAGSAVAISLAHPAEKQPINLVPDEMWVFLEWREVYLSNSWLQCWEKFSAFMQESREKIDTLCALTHDRYFFPKQSEVEKLLYAVYDIAPPLNYKDWLPVADLTPYITVSWLLQVSALLGLDVATPPPQWLFLSSEEAESRLRLSLCDSSVESELARVILGEAESSLAPTDQAAARRKLQDGWGLLRWALPQAAKDPELTLFDFHSALTSRYEALINQGISALDEHVFQPGSKQSPIAEGDEKPGPWGSLRRFLKQVASPFSAGKLDHVAADDKFSAKEVSEAQMAILQREIDMARNQLEFIQLLIAKIPFADSLDVKNLVRILSLVGMKLLKNATANLESLGSHHELINEHGSPKTIKVGRIRQLVPYRPGSVVKNHVGVESQAIGVVYHFFEIFIAAMRVESLVMETEPGSSSPAGLLVYSFKSLTAAEMHGETKAAFERLSRNCERTLTGAGHGDTSSV